MFTKISRVLSALLIAGILLASVTFPTSVRADSTITVNTTDDELNTDGDCSLREAIQAANTNAAVDACTAGSGADTITVPAGTFTLTIAGADEDLNATGDLDITNSVTINGAGAGTTTIQAGTLGYPNVPNGIDRVLHIFSGITVSISDVTIANGNSRYYGGGIYSLSMSTLTVTNSAFYANSAYSGGGMFNRSSGATLTNVSFVSNGAQDAAGGLFDEWGGITLTNVTFKFNRAGRLSGGMYNGGNGTLMNVTFWKNSSYEGGGMNNTGNPMLTNVTFEGNTATTIGGGMANSGMPMLTNVTFSGNYAEENGGGIYNYAGDGIYDGGTLTVTNSAFSGNSATSYDGGGIYNGGTLTVTNSTFSDNSANEGGGGGIFNYRWAVLTIRNSTFSGNFAKHGGGIFNHDGTSTVTNSTFSGNSATVSYGGGIYNGGGSLTTLTVTNSTFSGNVEGAGGPGGSIRNAFGILIVNNSILANTPSGVDCYNISGTVSGTHNLIETDGGGANACGTTASIHSDPNLGALADNGGPTQTFALLAGSPAINAADDAICAAAPVSNTSQNGLMRPQGAHCDIGSYELPITTLTLRSVYSTDGWILESTGTSGVGGTINVNGQAIVLGDDAADKQFRSILHFNTSTLPDNAVITKVTLKIKKKAVVGTDPFTTHQYIKVDIRSGGFSNNTALQLTDFQAAASKNWIGTIKNTPVGDWYSTVLNSLAFPFINLTSATQFRLYFKLDDDNDNITDYIQFFSGNASAADRPQLIVEYYVP
jgi:CSLREA domain-containing protein